MPSDLDFEYEWSQLVAKAWDDPAFKQRLLADPAAVLKENGLKVPAGVQVKVVENTDKVVHLTLPAKPSPAELSEEELHRAAGGHCGGGGCERCRCGGCERCRGCGGCERCRGCERCGCERCGCERPHD
jgi:hypothetical protein